MCKTLSIEVDIFTAETDEELKEKLETDFDVLILT